MCQEIKTHSKSEDFAAASPVARKTTRLAACYAAAAAASKEEKTNMRFVQVVWIGVFTSFLEQSWPWRIVLADIYKSSAVYVWIIIFYRPNCREEKSSAWTFQQQLSFFYGWWRKREYDLMEWQKENIYFLFLWSMKIYPSCWEKYSRFPFRYFFI